MIGKPNVLTVLGLAYDLIVNIHAELILEIKRAEVGYLQVYDLNSAGLPESLGIEYVGSILYRHPFLGKLSTFYVFIFEFDVEVARCDDVVLGRDTVREPRKRRSRKHRNAQEQRKRAHQKRTFRAFLVRHIFMTS